MYKGILIWWISRQSFVAYTVLFIWCTMMTCCACAIFFVGITLFNTFKVDFLYKLLRTGVMATCSTIILCPPLFCMQFMKTMQRQIQPGNKLMVIIRSNVFRMRHKWMDAAWNKSSLLIQSSFNIAQLNGKEASIHSIQSVDWTAWLEHCTDIWTTKSWLIKEGPDWDWTEFWPCENGKGWKKLEDFVKWCCLLLW